MIKKLIIEVRLNEYAGRDENPHVPWTADEIVADAIECHAAGAAIIHFHGRGPAGEPDHRYEAYREIVKRIRASCDVLIHPTLGASHVQGDARSRLATVEQLTRDGVPVDLAPIDFVTTNLDMLDVETHRFSTEDHTYVNTTGTLRYFAERLRQINVRAYPLVWSVPGLRQAIAFARSGLLDRPLLAQFVLSSGEMIFAHPGTIAGLEALRTFLPDDVPTEWSVIHIGGGILPFIDHVAHQGGHLSFGLGDHRYAELGSPSNSELVRRVIERVRDTGRELATPADARRIYGIGDGGVR